MISSIVRETLLGWHISFFVKKKGMASSFVHFLDDLKGREWKIICKQGALQSILKDVFLCNLLLWAKLYIDKGPLYLIWLYSLVGFSQMEEVVSCSPSFFFLLCLLVTVVHTTIHNQHLHHSLAMFVHHYTPHCNYTSPALLLLSSASYYQSYYPEVNAHFHCDFMQPQ